ASRFSERWPVRRWLVLPPRHHSSLHALLKVLQRPTGKLLLHGEPTDAIHPFDARVCFPVFARLMIDHETDIVPVEPDRIRDVHAVPSHVLERVESALGGLLSEVAVPGDLFSALELEEHCDLLGAPARDAKLPLDGLRCVCSFCDHVMPFHATSQPVLRVFVSHPSRARALRVPGLGSLRPRSR